MMDQFISLPLNHLSFISFTLVPHHSLFPSILPSPPLSSSSSLVELWYSRTTLILGVVFVFAYIMSWGWMTYVMEEAARNSVS